MPTKRRAPRKKRKQSKRVIRKPKVSRWPIPFPPKKYCTMVYKDSANLTATAGNDILARLVLNGCYDPDYDNVFGNRQVNGFDQLCTNTGPYLNYMVVGWTLIVRLQNASSAPLSMGYSQSRTLSAYDTWSEVEGANETKIIALNAQESKPNVLVFHGNVNEHVAFGS